MSERDGNSKTPKNSAPTKVSKPSSAPSRPPKAISNEPIEGSSKDMSSKRKRNVGKQAEMYAPTIKLNNLTVPVKKLTLFETDDSLTATVEISAVTDQLSKVK